MKIALIGGAPSWRRAPWGNSEWRTWAHSSLYVGVSPRQADLWWDVHLPEVRQESKTWSDDYPAWLMREEGRTSPVIVEDVDPRPPNSLVLPRAEIFDWLKSRGYTGKEEYVTSTVAWQMLYAMYLGATQIGLWGINFEDKAEYQIQRPCAEHWIGAARMIGIDVYVTPTSKVGRDSHVYGFDGHRPELLAAHGQLAPGQAIRLTKGFAMGQVPLVPVPPQVQALIDEEIEVFGVDTAARWRERREAEAGK